MDVSNSVKNRVQYYSQRRDDILSGKIKPIPFFGLPRLTKYIPGIIPGLMYKITSGTGAGKTNFCKYAFVYQPIFYAIKYGVNFQVIYFALEESEQEFIDGLFIHILKRKYSVSIDIFSLQGMTTTPVDENVLKAIKMAEKEVSLIMTYIKVIDDCYTPDAMYNKCKDIANKIGKFEVDALKKEVYVPNDPSQVVLVVCDHASLIEEQYDDISSSLLTHHKSISRWHTRYARKIITKQWKWTVLNIQQQDGESEKQQFTQKGDNIIAKVKPTLQGLADNKIVGRDDQVVISIFAPERFGIETYKGIDIDNNTPESFGDNFREIQILKSRFGTPNVCSPLFFDGKHNIFYEMPLPTDKDFKTTIKEFYKIINK